MKVCALSGNEVFCLDSQGFLPAELVVGNSVRSLGVSGAIGSSLRTVAGGEVASVTELISEGRHAAMNRLVEEAKRHGARGVTGVTTELSTLAGYTEFLSQGTSLSGGPIRDFFTTSASGTELYCHLEAGYRPIGFVMGNVAYALGVGRGILGGLSTLALGEVHQFSEMYNKIRHLALYRMRREAAALRANAVVDVRVEVRPFGLGVVELLMTGTAAFHPAFGDPTGDPAKVVTSELSGAELFSLAKLGYAPSQLVMATSVYSLGLVGGIFASFRSLAAGEIAGLTDLVYGARENCLRLLEAEAKGVGSERVIGSGLQIREISPGLIEVVAVGTGVRKLAGLEPKSDSLPVQAIVRDEPSLTLTSASSFGERSVPSRSPWERRVPSQTGPTGCLVLFLILALFSALMASSIFAALR